MSVTYLLQVLLKLYMVSGNNLETIRNTKEHSCRATEKKLGSASSSYWYYFVATAQAPRAWKQKPGSSTGNLHNTYIEYIINCMKY